VVAAGVPALLDLPQPERDCAVADTYHQLRNHPDD
jgi:hypothetical protein